MRQIALGALAVVVSVALGVPGAFALFGADEARGVSPEEEARLERQQKIMEKKTEINGSRWEVSVSSQHGTKGRLPSSDVLYFQDGRFRSQNLVPKGFNPTNYTLTLPESEGAVTTWETMQTSTDSDEGIAFWKGQWKDDTMTGIIVRSVPDEDNEDYYFTSSAKEAVSPVSDVEEEQEADSGIPKALVSSSETGRTGSSKKGRYGSLVSFERD